MICTTKFDHHLIIEKRRLSSKRFEDHEFYVHSMVTLDTDILCHWFVLFPSNWCIENYRSTKLFSLNWNWNKFKSVKTNLTWKSLCFRSSWLCEMHRSNNIGTQSGRCSIRPSKGVLYVLLFKSSASFHLCISISTPFYFVSIRINLTNGLPCIGDNC